MTPDLTPYMPTQVGHAAFADPKQAVARLIELHDASVSFLRGQFEQVLKSGQSDRRVRAFYPEVRVTTTSYASVDSRLSFGHLAGPGTYATTITRPDLFRDYLEQQIGLLIENHGVSVEIGYSDTPIPVHFAVAGADAAVPAAGVPNLTLRDVFDVPDLATTNDDIVNGTYRTPADGVEPLAPFTAQRIDYSLARLSHYTPRRRTSRTRWS